MDAGTGIIYLGAFFVALFLLFVIIHGIINGAKKGKIRSEHKRKEQQLRQQGFLLEKTYRKPVVYDVEAVPAGGGIVYYNYLAFDFSHGLCAYEYRIFPLRSVEDVSLIKDTTVVKSATARQEGWAVGGGFTAVGGISGQAQMNSAEKSAMIAVQVLLDDPILPSVVIPFSFGIADKASETYQNAALAAQEVYGTFESIVRANRKRAGK